MDAVTRFRNLIADKLGLHFDDAKLDYLGEVLRRRARAGVPAYLERLAREPGNELGNELGALAEELTVGETYFFRNRAQLDAFVQVALRERMQVRAATKQLRILSAGCASGEEPYSLAILAKMAGSAINEPGWTVAIRGVDVNPAALQRAAAGRYSGWALRETPEELQRAWFRADGRDFVLDAAIRRSVQLEQRNLAAPDRELWTPASYDIVFCRNVLMYFTPEVARRIVDQIARALVPGGYLFLGHAETLRGLSHAFSLCHTHGTFYYRRRPDHERSEEPPLPAVTVAPAADSWVDTIRRSADRIRELSEQPVGKAAPAVASTAHAARALVEHERFDEALALFDQAVAPHDADALLLHAVLLVHRARYAEAEACCRRMLALDDLDAGAHYVLALCREASGDRDGAVEQAGTAAYLDPTFAMPRLQLGLIARRAGDGETAKRELAHALLLLQREDASRVLLFGGGFRREALVALCRAELARAEGAA